ncbi:MAG: phosphoserine phosphatase SerB [Hyphomicrobiaceae bacterium]|nr:phosphoserine phosphatase SerB [Hyphomicrobiaceae bacterium]
MPYLSIVVAVDPQRPTLTPAGVRPAWDQLPGAIKVDQSWLAKSEAWSASILVDSDDAARQALAIVQRELVGASIDFNVVPDGKKRRKMLLVADMESTIIEQEMLDELADFIGARRRIADITERAMRGELDFEAALKERVAMLAGLDAAVLDQVAERITYMPGARELIATMKSHGAYCALVSGGFTVFTARVAERLGFDEHQANTLEVVRGKLTGRVIPPILGREAKLDALRRIARERGVDMALTMAVGDGANDLAMLAEAGLGVAFRAKEKVAAAMREAANGAVVTNGDLTSLLYLQGYRQQEFSRP